MGRQATIDYWVKEILRRRHLNEDLTGRALFISLPKYISQYVSGMLFDPFYSQMSRKELYEWIDDHIIFSEEGVIIALYDGNTILWEREDQIA